MVENGGSYSDVELDKYLGAFDTIELVYRDGFLSDDHLCSYSRSTSKRPIKMRR